MSAIKGIINAPQDLYASSSTQGTDLGAFATTGDGREFRYVKAGASALVPGTLVQAPAQTTANQDLGVVAASIGAKTLTVASSTTVTANALTGGFVATTTGTGYGYAYKIAGNLASAASSLVITLEDPIVVALDTTTKVDLVPSPYNGVVVNPTTASSAPLGAAITAIPASNYGWIQTKGVVPLTASGALTVGLGVAPSTATAGNVIASTTFTASVPGQIGFAVTGVAANETGLVDLRPF